MFSSTSKEKYIEASFLFLLHPLDLHSVHLQRKCVQHLTLEVLQHISNLMLDGGGRGRGVGHTLANSTFLPSYPRMVPEDNFDCLISQLVDISS